MAAIVTGEFYVCLSMYTCVCGVRIKVLSVNVDYRDHCLQCKIGSESLPGTKQAGNDMLGQECPLSVAWIEVLHRVTAA